MEHRTERLLSVSVQPKSSAVGRTAARRDVSGPAGDGVAQCAWGEGSTADQPAAACGGLKMSSTVVRGLIHTNVHWKCIGKTEVVVARRYDECSFRFMSYDRTFRALRQFRLLYRFPRFLEMFDELHFVDGETF